MLLLIWKATCALAVLAQATRATTAAIANMNFFK
jgi:hypothetical protein